MTGGGGRLPSLQRSAPPVLQLNPGARPAVPQVPVVPAPPLGDIGLAPDRAPVRPVRLEGLEAIPWDSLTHADGPVGDIPARITGLAGPASEWAEPFGELANLLLHQGSCYPATGPALTMLARLITQDALTAGRRRDVYITLLSAADQYGFDIILDADLAAALGRPPQPGAWTADVRDKVGAVVPGLLRRRAVEPPANQLALAALAAAFPDHGHALQGQIAELAAGQAGTQVGAYGNLALLLVAGDAGGALDAARDVTAWNDELAEFDIDDELAEPGLRALHVLVGAVCATVGAC